MSRSIFCLVLVVAIGVMSPFEKVQAADGTWTNTGTGSWTDIANWSGGIVADGADSTADFSTLDLTAGHGFVTLDADRTIGNLLFADSPWTHSWLLQPGTGGTLTLATSTGTPTIDIQSNTFIQTVVDGTQGLNKTGSGTLEWDASGSNYNPITGTINVSEGTLKLVRYDSVVRFFYNASATVPEITVSAGAKLFLQARSALLCWGENGWETLPVTLSGGTLETSAKDLFVDQLAMDTAPSSMVNGNSAIVYIGSSPSNLWTVAAEASGSTVSGTSNLTLYNVGEGSTFQIDVARGTAAADLTITSGLVDHFTMTGLPLIKTGDGILALTGANAYTGNTDIQEGTLSINSACLSDTSNVYIDGDACIDLAFAGTDTISELYLNGAAASVGTWGAIGSAADHTSSLITGTGLLDVTVAVPEPGILTLLTTTLFALMAFASYKKN